MIIRFSAAWSSSFTTFLVKVIILVCDSSKEVEGITSSFTSVSFGPLISCTTSSILQPITSVISSSVSCATPTILSFGFNLSDFSAGPPGTKEEIVVYNPSVDNKAPMPSKDKLISISKSSVLLGDI